MEYAAKVNRVALAFFVLFGLVGSAWSSAAHAQQLHSFTHEELEDHRQENVVRNMHFADDVLKAKFLEVYVPYQERLFKVDKQIRDLTSQYLSEQGDGKILSGAQAREILAHGLRLQQKRNEIL